MEQPILINALVYLAAAVVAVPISKRLGLGAVLGYLLAGIAIGPWGLRLIGEVEDILHFSEFGVVLLLFLIGLELEPKRLWAMRRPVFGTGSAQVLGVAGALCAAALLAGVDWKVALIGALGLSLSSTAIALATLAERNLKGTPSGACAFSILLFQDIAAIPMIAIVPLLGVAAAASEGSAWLDALRIAAVIVAIIFSGRYLVRPALRVIAKSGLREIFTAFALLLVISIALLMQWVGLSMALGAFMAGVLLADSQYRHALETDLEPFKGLLLGLFFIAVGMSVDFGVFMAQPWLILGIICAFMTIKIAVLYSLAMLVGIPRSQRALFAFLLSQGGKFAFVVFGAAQAAQVLPAGVASILIVVVALSMVTTQLLLIACDKLIAPRFRAAKTREADSIEANQNHVIIAGFGRFGQIVGRLLTVNRIKLTVLDHDPDQIDLVHAAGAAHARALVVAIDDIDDSLKLVEAVRLAFPALPIMARARNVTHYYDLMDRGVTIIERETFKSALLLGRAVLCELGFGAYRARQAAQKFKKMNIENLDKVYPFYKDQEQYMSMAKQARDELETMFSLDAQASENDRQNGWDS